MRYREFTQPMGRAKDREVAVCVSQEHVTHAEPTRHGGARLFMANGHTVEVTAAYPEVRQWLNTLPVAEADEYLR